MFDRYLYCLMKCHPPGSKEEDSGSHILNCKLLGSHTQLKIIDMYSNNIEKQAILANMAGKYMRKCEKLLEDQKLQLQPGA